MVFSHSKRADSIHTASNFSTPRDCAEMCAKWLHLQEVMCLRNTGNYITEEHENGAIRQWLKELKEELKQDL
jgi:hypothetical protein